MNNFTPRSRVVLAEITKRIIEKSINEIWNEVVVFDTPHDTNHEMTIRPNNPCRSGRSIRPIIRFTPLGET